jgi:hypothetical protein
MANLQRLTERVKKMEEWVKENEVMGGPQGVLDTFVFLLNGMKAAQEQTAFLNRELQGFRTITFEFMETHEMTEEWNEFVQEKQDAVQKQETEEVPLQEEAESGKEAVKAPKEKVKED